MRQRNSYNKVLSITQTDESIFLQKGLALHQAGQLQEARNVYAEILKKNKNQLFISYSNKGWSYLIKFRVFFSNHNLIQKTQQMYICNK